MSRAVATSTKRIKKEIADLAKENLGQITLTPNESNIFSWLATIPGPVGSPYEGGMFDVDIKVPQDYPFSPPALQFLTKVYHCNINSQGGICLDLLKTAWSPALSLYKVVLSLSSLLTDPNPADPLVPGIANEYKRNRKQHDATAREWTKLYAKPKSAPPTSTPATAASTSSSAVANGAARPAQPRVRSFIRPEALVSSSTPPASASGSASGNTSTSGNIGNGNGSTSRASSRSTPTIPPAAPTAGVRRTHAQANGTREGNANTKRARDWHGNGNVNGGEAIVVPDDDEDANDVEDMCEQGEEDFEVLGNSSRVNMGATGAGRGRARGGEGGAEGRRGAKRVRGNGNGEGGANAGTRDDEIVID